MPTKMKAAIYHDVRDIQIEEVEIPTLPPGYALLDTKVSGICGSDLHSYLGHWGRGKTAPGHEMSGAIAEVGEGVANVKVGDRVCVECFSHCGECVYCQTGNYNHCKNRGGVSGKSHAGFAEFSLVHSSALIHLPDCLSFEQGTLVEPLAVSYRAFWRSNATYQHSVAVFGAGAIGLLAMAVAKASGVRETIISAKYESQANMAKRLGADHVIRTENQNVQDEVKNITDGLGVGAVIDTVGSAQSFRDALAIARKQGAVVLVAGYYRPLEVDLGPIVGSEVYITGSNCYGYSGMRRDYEWSIELITSGKVKAADIVTHRFALDEIAEAFRVAGDKTSGSIKVHIEQ